MSTEARALENHVGATVGTVWSPSPGLKSFWPTKSCAPR